VAALEKNRTNVPRETIYITEGIMNIYEHMHSLPIEGDDSNVDALTVTATGLQGKIAVGLILDDLKEYRGNQKKHPFYFQGATGWQAGSIRYAEKFNSEGGKLWVIMMITGEMSRKCFKTAMLVESDIKVTRCDLSCDVFLYEKVIGIPRMIKDNYKGKYAIKMIESNTGETLYVGSRQSESMIRIYDKSSEFGLDQGRVWRWEVEFKGGLAPMVAREVRDGGVARARELIFQEARHKDIPSPIIEGARGIKRERVSVSSPEMQLAWLAKQVAPTVRWLSALGMGSRVREAIQLPLIGDD
jgi:Replication initiation factor